MLKASKVGSKSGGFVRLSRSRSKSPLAGTKSTRRDLRRNADLKKGHLRAPEGLASSHKPSGATQCYFYPFFDSFFIQIEAT